MPKVKRLTTRKKTKKRKQETSGGRGQAIDPLHGRKKLCLPTKPNEPPDNLNAYCTIIYGEKGIGKTSLAAQFPKSLTIQLEPRRRNLRIRQVEVKPVTREQFDTVDRSDWDDIKDYLDLAVTDKATETIVIDTVDRAYLACFRHCCWVEGVDHPNDIPDDYGKMWGTIKEEFEETFRRVLYSEKVGLLFISHAQTREVESTLGNFEIQAPTCPPACWKIIKAITDFAFYYGFYEAKRALVVRGNDFIWAACGGEDTFLDKRTGKAAAVISAGLSAKECYTNLTKSFRNKLVALQLEEELAERHKVPEEEENKPKKSWKKKGGDA